jgi:RND family efflux transporter MFP subunit
MVWHLLVSLRKQRFTKPAVIALVLLLTAAAAWLWAHAGHDALPTRGAQLLRDEKGNVIGLTLSREARQVLGVATTGVEPAAAGDSILAHATLTAPWQAHAYATARLPGRITRVHVRPGEVVGAGQLLAEVRSLELEDLRLELLNAANDVRLSAKVLEPLEALAGGRVVPERELIEARVRNRQNRNALEVARAKWLALGLSADRLDRLLQEKDAREEILLPVLSPIAGTVIHAELTAGKFVEPGEHLLEITDLSRVWVQMGVLESDLHKVRPGLPVELNLTAFPAETIRATVAVVGAALDPVTHVGAAWAELASPQGSDPRFLPGMSGQARVWMLSAKELLSVPAAALIVDGPERYVFVERPGNERATDYLKQNVVTGRRTRDRVQIVAGDVYPGDQVVTTGAHELASSFVRGELRLSREAERNGGVIVEVARPKIVEEVIEAEGQVEIPPGQRASAAAGMAGTLQKILVDRGQTVHAGDVLAEVASLELQNLQLELRKTYLQLGLLEETLRSLKDADPALARKQRWEAEGQRSEARNRLEILARKLKAIGLSLDQIAAVREAGTFLRTLPIRSPIDGTVVRFNKVLGQALKADESLFEIHDASRAWVRVLLSERDAPRVRLQQAARVRLVAEPSFLGEGTVARTSGTLGPDNRTLTAWVELKNQPPTGLRHDLLARVTLTVQRPAPVLALPLTSLVRAGARAYVFVRHPEGTFERRLVTTGRQDDRFVEITSGLREGEPVAIAGAAALQAAYASLR